jgi:hypothetical protein
MNWRFGLAVGLAIGVGMATSRGVETALEPNLGHLGALLMSFVAAVLVGGLVALLASWLLGRPKK